MHGLITVPHTLFSDRHEHKTRQKLTHCNDVCSSVVHAIVIFSSPLETNIGPGLQILVVGAQIFPRCHEQLERWDCARENGSRMCRHELLSVVWDLEIHVVN